MSTATLVLSFGAPAKPVWLRHLRDVLVILASRVDNIADECDDDLPTVLAMAKSGDDGAYRQVIERYQATITDQMRRFSRDRRQVEELVHDVFVEAYLSLHSFRDQAPFLHWLRKIAVRVGYRYWKQQATRIPTVSLATVGAEIEKTCSGEPKDAAEAAEMLDGILGLLKPRDRLVLTLLYWDDCTVAEAAELTGWSRAMVKVQAYRARKRLGTLLQEQNG